MAGTLVRLLTVPGLLSSRAEMAARILEGL